MGLLTQRKEHKVPDLSRYDYYYQRRDDYNKSPRLSAAAAYAASRTRGNPVLVQQRSQSFTQPRRVVTTRPRAKSRGAVEARDARETPRADSIIRTTRVEDGKGRTKSITRRAIKRINGVNYVETVTTTPLEDEDNARHFDEFSEPVDDYADAHEHPVRRVRKVRKATPTSPRSGKSTRSQRLPASPPRSSSKPAVVDDYEYPEEYPDTQDSVPFTRAPTGPSSGPIRRTVSTSRPVRSGSTRSVPKAGTTPQSPVLGAVAPGRKPLTEQEMYARALEIAQRNVYNSSDFPPEVLDNATQPRAGQGVSRMGQRSLRNGGGRGKKKFNLFHKDRDAGDAEGVSAVDAPRASGVSSLDNRLDQRVDPSAVSASTGSRRNLSNEEMYAQALAMSQSKAQRGYEEPESETQPLDLGGAERNVRSPQSNTAASFVTPAQTIDENYEDNFEDARNYEGDFRDEAPKADPYGNYSYPVGNDDRYDFEEPEPESEPEYGHENRAAPAHVPEPEQEYVEPGIEQEYVDPDRLPEPDSEFVEPGQESERGYEPDYGYEAEETYPPSYGAGGFAPPRKSGGGYSRRSGLAQDEDLAPPRKSGGGYSRRSGLARDEDLAPPRKSGGGYSRTSGLVSPLDSARGGFANHIASPEEVRAGGYRSSGAKDAVPSTGSPLRAKRQAVHSPAQSPLEDSAVRGGFDSEADLGGLGGTVGAGGAVGAGSGAGVAGDGIGRNGTRKSKGLSRLKTRKSLFGGRPEEQPLPDLPHTDLSQVEQEGTQAGYAPAQEANYYDGKALESRPKSKIKSMLNKMVEFGSENSGYQPGREAKGQQKAENIGEDALEADHPKTGKGVLSQAKSQKRTGLGGAGLGGAGVTGGAGTGDAAVDGTAIDGTATDGAAADGIDGTTDGYGVDDGFNADDAAVGGGAAPRSGVAATGGTATGGATDIGKKGGMHPWRRNAQLPKGTRGTTGAATGGRAAAAGGGAAAAGGGAAAAGGGAAAAGTTPAATTAQQPSNRLGTGGPAAEDASMTSYYGNEQKGDEGVTDEGFADGYADGLRDSQYESGYDRANRVNGVDGGAADEDFDEDVAGGAGGRGVSEDVGEDVVNGVGGRGASNGVGEDVVDGVENEAGDRYGVQDKLDQAKDSSWGQKALGKVKGEAQSQVKQQKGNIFKKLFKK